MSMSDPVSSSEIEDVLSSIRRLVAEESGFNFSSRVTEDLAKSTAEQDNRLVLTPQLRVADKERLTSEVPKREPDSNRPEVTSQRMTSLHLVSSRSDEKQRKDVPEATREEQKPAPLLLTEELRAAPDQSDATPASGGERTLHLGLPSFVPEEDSTEDTGEAPTFGHHDVLTAQIDEARAKNQAGFNTLELTIAKLEAVVSNRNEEWEPDGSEPDEQTPDRVPMFIARFSSKQDGEEDMAPPASIGHNSCDVPEAAPDAFFDEQKPAVPPAEPVEEPQASEIIDEAVEAIEAHPQVTRDLIRPENIEQANASVSDFDEHDEEDDYDGEALRILVSDIVREELQGVLGERITRNVRKLVRREVYRALAARDVK